MQWRWNEFESGGTHPAQSAGKFCLVASLHFLALKAPLVVLVSAFVMASRPYSLVTFLFAVLLLAVPPCPAIRKSGGGGARASVPHGVGATAYMAAR